MAHKAKTPDGKVYWVCDCKLKLPAMYNAKNKLNCPDNEYVCAHCFREAKKLNQTTGGEE